MKRKEIDLCRTVVIHGAPFTFRSLHAPDGRRNDSRGAGGESTLDRIVTVTLPAIEGFRHKPITSMKVVL